MNLLDRALRDRQASLIWWSVGVIVYCGFIIAVWPVIDGNEEFETLYSEMPDALMAMFGSDGFTDFTSPTGFLNTYLYAMILPFIFTGLAVSLGSSLIAGQEERGLLELVLSYPVTRTRLVLESVAGLVIGVFGLGVVTWLVMALAREPVGLDIGIGGLASATLGSVLFASMCGGAALVAGAASGSRGVATGVGWGVALVSYLVNVLGSVDASLDWLDPVSPLGWATAGGPLSGTVPFSYVALVAVIVSLSAASVVVFERHDLH